MTLRRIGKKVKGQTIEVNENRFWKPSIENPNNLLVSIKVKGKIVKFTNESKPQYLISENSKDSLISLLNNVKSNVESISEEHPIWKLNEETNTKEVIMANVELRLKFKKIVENYCKDISNDDWKYF